MDDDNGEDYDDDEKMFQLAAKRSIGAKRGKQIHFTRPTPKNVDREPEAKAW